MKPKTAKNAKRLNQTYFYKTSVVAFFAAMMTSSLAIAETENQRIEQFFNDTELMSNQTGNLSIIRQIGNNNRTHISQSYSSSYQTGNFSRVNQIGDWNKANIQQAGGNNLSVIIQSGNYHTANVTQFGKEQQLETFVTQLGQRSDVQVNQSGSGYRGISVEQRAYSGNARPVTVETY